MVPGCSHSVLPATLSSSRPQCLHVNPSLSVLNPDQPDLHLLSWCWSHPQCVYLLRPCAPTNIPFPFPPSHLFCLSLFPHSPFPSPLPPDPPFSPLSFSFSVCLTSVSFPRALWCLRIKCSRMSSWCSSSPPTPPSHTSQPTRCLTSAYQQPSPSHVAACLLSTAGTTPSVSALFLLRVMGLFSAKLQSNYQFWRCFYNPDIKGIITN